MAVRSRGNVEIVLNFVREAIEINQIAKKAHVDSSYDTKFHALYVRRDRCSAQKWAGIQRLDL
jgi:uncharacterized protein (DUF924 family)